MFKYEVLIQCQRVFKFRPGQNLDEEKENRQINMSLL